ncbi:GT4 family glycosyltransferase PelF [Fodinibius saliphilus]|uniref:GT4 family glycosyltransferase PelF n=1 Tax=Fodinibius saliphilus TaxID=1920650 RepID=UPI001107BF76|nr:GT4 family glycosyltransferase PelF [Fodinibius saliphilus]
MINSKPTILFETEGSYPYSGGGVSTWAHILCTELVDDIDFIIMALTGNPYVEARYRKTPNIKSIIHIPLWGVEEPVSHFDKDRPFSEHLLKKANTSNDVIEQLFMPMYRRFLDHIFDPFQSAEQAGELIYGFWKFFQRFDYKKTLSHPLLWDAFKRRLEQYFADLGDHSDSEHPSMLDVTFGMRWIYHFMMPLAVDIPKVSATHATLAGFPAISSIVAKFEYGTPMVVTDHGVYIRERLINVSQEDMSYFSQRLLVNMSTFMTRVVYYFADRIAPVTSINAKWEKKYEATEDRIRPIYNGVDADLFRPQPKPEHTQDQPTVVAVAHVFPLKDIETMIRSCELVRREIPDVQYIIYGSLEVDKAYVQKCKDLVEELNLEDHFTFGGYHDTPSKIFNEGDLSILSSISEGFPYTVLESMSCSRPVVATDVGGVREAVEGCGILCKPRNARELADGVIKLLEDDDLRIELGQKARSRVLLKYTITKSVNNYRNLYQSFHEQKHIPQSGGIGLSAVKKVMEEVKADV